MLRRCDEIKVNTDLENIYVIILRSIIEVMKSIAIAALEAICNIKSLNFTLKTIAAKPVLKYYLLTEFLNLYV